MLIPMLRKISSGVSWKNPIIAICIKLLDPIDLFVRYFYKANHIPKYSIRVRSNGLRSQFGGVKFIREGHYISSILTTYADLRPSSNILEIGCGCGRTAFSLASKINDGNFTGIDIEPISLYSCINRKELKNKKFNFFLMDVYNREYNPTGKTLAKNYHFNFPDETFDIIFLVSVFTHMLPDDISNYINEISRMLKPGGRCLFSLFLMDYGTTGKSISFPYRHAEAYTYKKNFPEIAVGYPLTFFTRRLPKCAMSLKFKPLLGTWRGADGPTAQISFPQDILVLTKNSEFNHASSNK